MTDLPDDWYEEVDGRSRMLNAGKVEAEVDPLRAAIEFWAMAHFPERAIDPNDVQGRVKASGARTLANATLWYIACERKLGDIRPNCRDHLEHMAQVRPGHDGLTAKWALAEIDRLTIARQRRPVIQSALDALDPHAFVPSPAHMGDCAICGHMQDAAIHAWPSPFSPKKDTAP